MLEHYQNVQERSGLMCSPLTSLLPSDEAEQTRVVMDPKPYVNNPSFLLGLLLATTNTHECIVKQQ